MRIAPESLQDGYHELDSQRMAHVYASTDQGKTWSKLEPVNLGFPRSGATIGQGPTELMVRGGKSTLFFSTHSQTWGTDWRSWQITSDESCRIWSQPKLLPGRLAKFTFIRNLIVLSDGTIVAPFQHYQGPPEGSSPPVSDSKPWHATIRHYVSNPRNGGRTWPRMASRTDIPNPGSKFTLYSLGDGRVAMLHNPNPAHRSPLALRISFDGLKTWAYQRVLVPQSSDGPQGRLNYPDGFVSRDGQWLHFAYDDNRHRAMVYSAKLPLR